MRIVIQGSVNCPTSVTFFADNDNDRRALRNLAKNSFIQINGEFGNLCQIPSERREELVFASTRRN